MKLKESKTGDQYSIIGYAQRNNTCCTTQSEGKTTLASKSQPMNTNNHVPSPQYTDNITPMSYGQASSNLGIQKKSMDKEKYQIEFQNKLETRNK